MRFGLVCKRYEFIAALVLLGALPAKGALIPFTDRTAFEAATSGLVNLNFEGVAPSNSSQDFPNPAGLALSGITFRTSGSGPSGTGVVSVYGSTAAEQSPILNTGTGSIVVWTPPDQPGTAYLDVWLSGGKTAFAVDLWTLDPSSSPLRIIVNSGEATENLDINTPDRPAPYFFGVVSDLNVILLVRFVVPAGQVGLIVDNVSAGVRDDSPDPIPEPSSMVLLGCGLVWIVQRKLRTRTP